MCHKERAITCIARHWHSFAGYEIFWIWQNVIMQIVMLQQSEMLDKREVCTLRIVTTFVLCRRWCLLNSWCHKIIDLLPIPVSHCSVLEPGVVSENDVVRFRQILDQDWARRCGTSSDPRQRRWGRWRIGRVEEQCVAVLHVPKVGQVIEHQDSEFAVHLFICQSYLEITSHSSTYILKLMGEIFYLPNDHCKIAM